MHLAIGMPSMTEIAIIALIVFLLFGVKKIPEFMKNLGTGIKELRNGFKQSEED